MIHRDEHVVIDRDKKCSCKKPKPKMVNYDPVWYEADIICSKCGNFIRSWDASS